MRTRTVILCAAASNLTVLATTYVTRGWNAAGAYAAARNTARLSAVWFAVAFAAPRLGRFFRSLPPPATLVHAFFAAHFIHFCAVAVVLTRFGFPEVSQHPGRTTAVVLGGFMLVLVASWTARPGPFRIYSYLHRVALYAVFLIFFLAFVAHPPKPLRAIALLLALSLVLRVSSGMKFYSPRVKSVV